MLFIKQNWKFFFFFYALCFFYAMELFLFKDVVELPSGTMQAWLFCGGLLLDNFMEIDWFGFSFSSRVSFGKLHFPRKFSISSSVKIVCIWLNNSLL